MLKLRHKIVSYILVTVTIVSVAFGSYVQSVQATAIADYASNYIRGMLTGLGNSLSDSLFNRFVNWLGGEIDSTYDITDMTFGTFVDSFCSHYGWEPSDVYTEDELNQIIFKQNILDEMNSLFEKYLEETPEAVDVVWMPVISSDKLPIEWFNSTTIYYQMRSYADDRDYSAVQFFGTYTKYWGYGDLSDVYFVCSESADTIFNQVNTWSSSWGDSLPAQFIRSLTFLGSDGLGLSVPADAIYGMDDGVKVDMSATLSNLRLIYPFTADPSRFGYTAWQGTGFLVRGCNTDAASFVPVFRDKLSFMEWITGNGSYYKFDSGYQGGSITINPDADYSKITDAIADVMKQSMANGDNMSTMLSRMQATFSKTLGEISGALGDIEDNTQETNNWLQKIFDLLEAQQKELQDYFASSGESLDDLIGLLSHTDDDGNRTSIYDLLGSFLLLFRVQQEDLQAYMADAQDFFKLFPFELKSWISSARTDITDAIAEVVDAVKSMNMSVNINPDDLDPGGGDGESLWTQLGKGLAKILTAILDLLKVLIFKGLDALGYLAGVMVDNIGSVFDGIGEYFDRYIGYIEENTFFAEIRCILPEELGTFMVLGFFSIAIAGIIKYAKKG